MSAETPQHRLEFQNLLRFIRPQKVWTPENVKREGFVQKIGVLKDAVKEVLLNADDFLQERLNFLASYPEESRGFTIETDRNQIITKAFTIGLGEKESVYFRAKNPRIEGEEIHKFAPYASIITRDDLLKTIRNFILLEPKANELVGVGREDILKKMEKYTEDVKKSIKTDKAMEGFKNVKR